MTSIADMVQQHLGDDGVAELTRHLGVDPATAQAAVAAALPALVGAASTKLSAPGVPAMPQMGVGGLAGAAGGLLGHLFDGNHQSAAQQVSRHSGIDIHQAEKALLFLAPIVMARLARQRQEGATVSPASPTAAAPSPPASTTGTTAPAPKDETGGQPSGLGGVLDAVAANLSQGRVRRGLGRGLPHDFSEQPYRIRQLAVRQVGRRA